MPMIGIKPAKSPQRIINKAATTLTSANQQSLASAGVIGSSATATATT